MGLKLNNAASPATPASGKVEVFTSTAVAPNKRVKWINDAATVVNPLGDDGAITQSAPSAPSTTSVVGTMQALGGTFTPVATTRMFVMLSGDITNNTAADGAKVQLRFGTGTAPTDEAVLSGTTIGGLVQFINPATGAVVKAPFCVQGIVTGLTVGTAYWIDVGLAAITGGTATIADLSLSIHEI